MRKLVNKSLFLGASLAVLFLNSCTKKEDATTDDPRDKYEGKWTVNEKPGSQGSSVNPTAYSITISKTGSSSISIARLGNLTGSTLATVTGSTFSIATQTVSGETISGNGVYSSGKLTITYKLGSDDIIADCTK